MDSHGLRGFPACTEPDENDSPLYYGLLSIAPFNVSIRLVVNQSNIQRSVNHAHDMLHPRLSNEAEPRTSLFERERKKRDNVT
jgi:hypothetical protein